MPNISRRLRLIGALFRHARRRLLARLLQGRRLLSICSGEPAKRCADVDPFKHVFPLVVAELWAALFEFENSIRLFGWGIRLQPDQTKNVCFPSLFLSCARRLLIQAGYDVNIKDYDGWTPLHAAAHWGKEEACRVLVENLCDMDLINKMVSPHNSQVQPNPSFLLFSH